MPLAVVEETVGLIKARVMVNNIKEWLEMAIITAIQAPVKRIMEAGSKHTHTQNFGQNLEFFRSRKFIFLGKPGSKVLPTMCATCCSTPTSAGCHF